MPRARSPWRGRPICLFGHTHVAVSARMDGQRRLDIDAPQGHPEFPTTISAESKYLINPGSVGQPRDGDSRAAYAIADLERKVVTLYRVAYPIEARRRRSWMRDCRRCSRIGSAWDGETRGRSEGSG